MRGITLSLAHAQYLRMWSGTVGVENLENELSHIKTTVL